MTPITILQLLCLVLLAAILIGAAAQDLRTGQIADGFSVVAVLVFAAWAVAGVIDGQFTASSVGMAVAGAALVFGLGAAAFAAGALGGGDVKLLTAVSLFAGSARLFDFLAITALAGGGLAVAALAGASIGRWGGAGGAETLRARLRADLPLAPAIAVGGLWILFVGGSG